MATGETTFKVGDLLNNTFRIEAVLGRGGTSEVFRARNEISGRLVALKVLKAEFAGNEDFLVLMRREEEMRDIRHDAVVGYSENHRTADGHIYLVMDFVDGPSLEAKMKSGGMPADELITVGRRVSQGLSAAHERRIVHRDLSPDNIILKSGNPAKAVIIDFGIAKDANPGAHTIVGSEFAGKFSYAAPEQLGGQTDARSDIYSLGATLLATFRGESPRSGTNLLEVLERKKEPLDLSDVPEPLAGLLARMTAPDPAHRFQTCREIMAEIDRIQSGGEVDDTMAALLNVPAEEEGTVIRPAATSKAEKTPPPKPAPEKSGRSPLLPILLVLLLAGGGAAAWFGGLFGARLPLADPFVLTVERGQIGGPVLSGVVPSQQMLDRFTAIAEDRGGSQDLALARGDIASGWQEAVDATLERAEMLDVYSLRVEDNLVSLAGRTGVAEVRDGFTAWLAAAPPDGMRVEGNIAYDPPLLPLDALEPILTDFAACGPLALAEAPTDGYGIGDTIHVTGALPASENRLELFDRLEVAAEGRDIRIETEILNPALCEAKASLPALPSDGVGIDFSFGETGQTNASGRYFVGENPVIDLILPAEMQDGFLYVSIIDVTGSVFHLLPNMNRPGNSVADLRGGQSGEMRVRVAYPVSEGAPDKIAFLVDDSLLGKSKLLVLHADSPLFDALRPTTESVAGYAEALNGVDATGASLDSRVLTLAKP
ncbi:serine/threonine-protein kinase [Tropicimonas sp. TH_r6]|uniref:serine/threonine-protein kinase n=1 Tax=Tropicimonas sp. TH_r6 TaxID=3082085 RepID=UPI0029540BB4|nr:serine/threonine-protein kinase [Tropicimonas sp. TH_r6]MDV7143101.1 serine/threonine-protein kinase [Tropicimonas sp. TH_r6]